MEKAQSKNDISRIRELSYTAKELARKLIYESKELFDSNEILGEDFHKMLLAIQNLIEYLNRNYFKDEVIEKEVNTMTKTLYDPEVEKKGIETGIKLMKKVLKLHNSGESIESIAKECDVSMEIVKEIIE